MFLGALPETISIATSRTQPLRTAPAVATVITAQDLRDYGVRNVEEALRLVPGLHVGGTAIYGAAIGVRGFTGLRTSNVLFLLDGSAQSDRYQGEGIATLGTVPIDAIERIEVTRGPGSTVFGADAFNAVINVITRRVYEGSTVALSGGSLRTRKGQAMTGFSSGNLNGVLAVSGNTTDGPSPYFEVDKQTMSDALFGTNASFAPGHGDTSRKEGGAILNLTHGSTKGMLRYSTWRDIGLAGGIAGSIDPFGSVDYDTMEVRVSHDVVLGQDWDLSVVADWTKTHQSYDDTMLIAPGGFYIFEKGAFVDAEIDQEFLRLRADMRYSGFDGHFLAAGVGYDRNHFEITKMHANYVITDAGALPSDTTISGDYPNDTQNVGYIYLQDEWAIANKWSLTAGVRLDDYSDFGTQTSARAALVWTPAPAWTVKLLYGEGFRPPTQLETGRQTLPIYVPNADLDPEQLRSYDFSIAFEPSPSLWLRAGVFHHQTDDQIRQQDIIFAVTPENVGDQNGDGGELEWRWNLTRDLVFSGWYAYQWNIDETTGKDAGYSPHHRVFGSMRYRVGKAFFNLQGWYVGDRARVAEDPREEADEYGQLDFLARYQFTNPVSLEIDVRNLFNDNHYEATPGTTFPQDFPRAERNYYATIRIDF